MAQGKMLVSLILVVLVGIFIQVLLVFADMQDSPQKAALAFLNAYYGFDDKVLSERLCDNSRIQDDVNLVDQYIYAKTQESADRGFAIGMYTQQKLYHVSSKILDESGDKATIQVTGQRKSGLRAFFDKTDVQEVDVVLNLVKEGGKWKACGAFPL